MTIARLRSRALATYFVAVALTSIATPGSIGLTG